jgi:hypothetical protein
MSKLEELIAEKRAAGLTLAQAEEVAKNQIAWDEEQEKEAAKAAKKKPREKQEEPAKPQAKPAE